MQAAPNVSADHYATTSTLTFRTPSRNIACSFLAPRNERPAELVCVVGEHSWSGAANPGCQRSWNRDAIELRPRAVVRGFCPQDDEVKLAGARPLPYGRSLLTASYGCRSESSGLGCVSFPSGIGFFVNRRSFADLRPDDPVPTQVTVPTASTSS